jgi:hypothetical protein
VKYSELTYYRRIESVDLECVLGVDRDRYSGQKGMVIAWK